MSVSELASAIVESPTLRLNEEARLLRFPAIHGDTVVFTAEGDLWRVGIDGGLAQRLTGEVANGDLARSNFSGDYNPTVIRTERVNGEDHYVLELLAVDRGVTYHRVLLWVNKANYRPLKAEFYSLSNRLMKTCTYENFRDMAGKKRPTRLVMEDALRAGEQSVLEYEQMKLRDLPDKVFSKDYLKKLQ